VLFEKKKKKFEKNNFQKFGKFEIFLQKYPVEVLIKLIMRAF
jgi:hypothetical protein